MKLLVLFAIATGLMAQTHIATLTWTDTVNPAETTYKVYRFVGLCSGSPTFSVLASGITAKTYQDSPLQPGNYCYVVTAVYQAMESAYSNSALAAVLPFAPTALTATVGANNVSLAWTDADNPAGTTWSVQRASGLCSGSPSFTAIATGLTSRSYVDNTVSVGQYCYQVVATANGMQSPASGSTGAQVGPNSPSGLNIQVQ